MKRITIAQWKKMSAKQRSWVVCRALGKRATIFWHCTLSNGERIGGSYDSMKYCEGLINAARKLTAETARRNNIPYPHPMRDAAPVPTAAFPRYAEYDHAAIRLGQQLLQEHGSFGLRATKRGVTATSGQEKAQGDSIQEAVCLLVLKLRGLIATGGKCGSLRN